MCRILGFLVVLLIARPCLADPTGLWLTQDHDGVIAITQCDDRLCAHIAGFMLDHPNDPSPLDYRGVSQCGLPLISDARQIKPNLWKGHITDPRNGSVYGVELHVTPAGKLALRGFLGIPLLGQTQYWTRFDGTVPADCRLVAVDHLAKRTLTGGMNVWRAAAPPTPRGNNLWRAAAPPTPRGNNLWRAAAPPTPRGQNLWRAAAPPTPRADNQPR